MDYSTLSTSNLQSSIAGFTQIVNQLNEAKLSGRQLLQTSIGKSMSDTDLLMINWFNLDSQLQAGVSVGFFAAAENWFNAALTECQKELKSRQDAETK